MLTIGFSSTRNVYVLTNARFHRTIMELLISYSWDSCAYSVRMLSHLWVSRPFHLVRVLSAESNNEAFSGRSSASTRLQSLAVRNPCRHARPNSASSIVRKDSELNTKPTSFFPVLMSPAKSWFRHSLVHNLTPSLVSPTRSRSQPECPLENLRSLFDRGSFTRCRRELQDLRTLPISSTRVPSRANCVLQSGNMQRPCLPETLCGAAGKKAHYLPR